MVMGCGTGCDHGQMWNDAIMQDVECGATMLCKMWCGARCGGAVHNVANIWCNLAWCTWNVALCGT